MGWSHLNPVDENQARRGVSGSVALIAQLSHHVDDRIEGVGLVAKNRGTLDEDVADRGKRVSSTQVRCVTVPLLKRLGRFFPNEDSWALVLMSNSGPRSQRATQTSTCFS